jgi:hypothetical protein
MLSSYSSQLGQALQAQPDPYAIAFWTALGGGLAAIAGGIIQVLLASYIDGRRKQAVERSSWLRITLDQFITRWTLSINSVK